MALQPGWCAYCSKYTETEAEHVVPRSFAPAEMRGTCQWIIVRACSTCNRGFSADESDFRGFAVMANSRGVQPVRDRLFHDEVVRNWQRPRGAGAGRLRHDT
jgi:5-methylcytosine-specific restriction endonuclease McrA